MPAEGATLEFEGWSKTQRHPVVIYADFEAILIKISESRGDKTQAFEKHYPMSFGIKVKANKDIPTEILEIYGITQLILVYRRSEIRQEVARHFMETVVELARKIAKLFKMNTPIIMNAEDVKIHTESTRCNLCKTILSFINHKVADHDHLSGKFRQSLCNTCNLKLKTPKYVPCFFHNLYHYDAHFIVTELGYDENSISVIPNSEENFISFSK